MRLSRFALSVSVLSAAALTGCGGEPAAETKAPMVNVETPLGDVKVDVDGENGAVSVDVDKPAAE